MKARIYSQLFKLLFISLIVVACKPEVIPPDPCEQVSCEFGTCVDGTCECDDTHTGANCDELIVPETVSATSVELNYIPDPCGTYDGDLLKSGDVYVQIRLSNLIVYDTRDLYFPNSDCFGGCDFGKALSLDMETTYQLRVYDWDNTSADDLMGSFSFRPADQLSGFDELPSGKWLMVKKEQSCSKGNFSSSIPMRFSLVNPEFAY